MTLTPDDFAVPLCKKLRTQLSEQLHTLRIELENPSKDMHQTDVLRGRIIELKNQIDALTPKVDEE